MKNLIKSKSIIWLMLNLYVHAIINSIWADIEALSHTQIHFKPSIRILNDSSEELLSFDFHLINKEKNLNIQGQLTENGLIGFDQLSSEYSFEKIEYKQGHAWGYLLKGEDFGQLYMNHDGAMAYIGSEKAKDHSLSLKVTTPLLLRNVFLKELKILGDYATFSGVNHITSLKGSGFKNPETNALGTNTLGTNTLGTYDIIAGATLEAQSLTFKNVNFLQRGSLLSQTFLDVKLEGGSCVNEGFISADTLRMTSSESMVNTGSINAKKVEGDVKTWQEQGVLSAPLLTLRATDSIRLTDEVVVVSDIGILETEHLYSKASLNFSKLNLQADIIKLQGNLENIKSLAIQANTRLDSKTALNLSEFYFQGAGDVRVHEPIVADSILFEGVGTLKNKSRIIARENIKSLMSKTHNQGILSSQNIIDLDHHVFNKGYIQAKNLNLQDHIFLENELKNNEITLNVDENLTYSKDKGRIHNKGHIKIGKDFVGHEGTCDRFAEFINEGTFVVDRVPFLPCNKFINTGLIKGRGCINSTEFLENKGRIKGDFAYYVSKSFLNEGHADFSYISGSGTLENRGFLKAAERSYSYLNKISVRSFINNSLKEDTRALLEAHTLIIADTVNTFHNGEKAQIQVNQLNVECEKSSPTQKDLPSFRNDGRILAKDLLYKRHCFDNSGFLNTTHFSFDSRHLTNYSTGVIRFKKPSEAKGYFSNFGTLLGIGSLAILTHEDNSVNWSNYGKISLNDLNLSVGTVRNKGHIQTEENLTFQARKVVNDKTLVAKKKLDITTKELELSDAQHMIGNENLHLTSTGPLKLKGEVLSERLHLDTPYLTIASQAKLEGQEETRLKNVKYISIEKEGKAFFTHFISDRMIDKILNEGFLSIRYSVTNINHFENREEVSLHSNSFNTLHTLNQGKIYLTTSTGFFIKESFKNTGHIMAPYGSLNIIMNSENKTPELRGFYRTRRNINISRCLSSSIIPIRDYNSKILFIKGRKEVGLVLNCNPNLTDMGTITTAKNLYLTNYQDTFSTLDSLHANIFQASDTLYLSEDNFILNQGQSLDLLSKTFFQVKSFENNGTIKARGGLEVQASGPIKIGLSNDAMGSIRVEEGPLTLTGDTIDNRYGQLFGQGDTVLTAKAGSVLVGDMKLIRSPHAQTNFGNILNDSHFLKQCSNGSYVSSLGSLTINGLQGDLTLLFGQLYAKDLLSINVDPQKGSISNTSGSISSSSHMAFKAHKILLTRPPVQGFAAYSHNSNYTHITYYLECAEAARLQAMGDITLWVNEIDVMASEVMAGKNIWHQGRHIVSPDKPFDVTDNQRHHFNLSTQHRYYEELEAGRTWYTHGSRVSAVPAMVKAGEQICIQSGNMTTTGTIGAPVINIDVSDFQARNNSTSRAESNPIQTTLIIDLVEAAKSLYNDQGFIKIQPDGSVGLDVDLPQSPLNLQNLLFYNEAPHIESMPSPMVHGIALDFILQKTLSDYLNTLNINGHSGSALYDYLHENGLSVRRSKGKEMITAHDVETMKLSFIAYQAKLIQNQLRLLAHLFVAPQDIRAPGCEGDIDASQTTTIKSDNDILLQNNRVIGDEGVTLKAKKDIKRETEKYWVTYNIDKNTRVSQEYAFPQQQVISKNGTVKAVSGQTYAETGCYTEAGMDVIRVSENNDIILKALELSRIETTTKTKRSFFSSSTNQTEKTTYTHVPNETKAGRYNLFTAKEAVHLKGTHEKAGKKIHMKAKDIHVEAAVSKGHTTSSSTTSGFMGQASQTSSSDTLHSEPSSLSAPEVFSEAEKSKIEGSQVNANTLAFDGETATIGQQKVTMNYSYSQDVKHLGGHQASGTNGGQEVGIDTHLNVGKLQSTCPIDLVNTSLHPDTEVEADIRHVHQPLRTWHHEWATSSGLSLQETAAFISLATAIATAGWGTAAAQGVGATSLASSAAVKAAVCGLSASLASNTYVHQGDVFRALEEVVQEKNLKSLAVNIALSSMMAGLDLPTADSFMDHLTENAYRASFSAGLSIAIEGVDPAEALRQGLLQAGVNTMASYVAGGIGSHREDLGYVGHKIAHGLLGALKAHLCDEDAASGALGAIIAEAMAEALVVDAQTRISALINEAQARGEVPNRETIYTQYMQETQQTTDLARVAAGFVALISGHHVNTADNAAQNALNHNFAPSIAIAGTAALDTYFFGGVLLASLSAIALKATELQRHKSVVAALEYLVEKGILKKTPEGYGVGDTVYEKADKAWQAALEHVPHLREAVQTVSMDPAPEPEPMPGFEAHDNKSQVFSTPIAESHQPLPGYSPDDTVREQEGYEAHPEAGPSIFEERIHVLYGKDHPTDPTYIGRTSGEGETGNDEDVDRILRNRDRNHHKNSEGFERAKPIHTSVNSDVIRGMEQQEIDKRGGAQSQGGTSSNKINSISDKNPNKQKYMDAASKVTGDN